MITSGISFQPGLDRQQQGGSGGAPASVNPVQEAIKVLSLRLPKVVGARAIAPNALLTGQGSGGNSRVDSVVNQVWARMFGEGMPTAAPSLPAATSEPASMPNFSGAVNAQPFTPPMDYSWLQSRPRVIFDGGQQGDFTVGPDGRPKGGAGHVGGVYEQAPNIEVPSAPPPQLPKWDQPLWSFGSGLPEGPEPAFDPLLL